MTFPTSVIQQSDTYGVSVGRVNQHFADSTQHSGSSAYDVKAYGASGTGSGGAAADQAGFAAAISAANAATYGGVVFIPPGNYDVTGPFVLDNETSIIGAGSPQVTINHTANNACFSSTT
jgi:Pectate lyase superfamily protein